MPRTPASLLVVDDDPFYLRMIEEVLRAEDWRIQTASDPREALRLAGAQTFAVVISDHKMPHLAGLELLREIRRISPRTTRILLTGVVEVQTVIEAVNGGDLYRFLVKPWLNDELIATVRAAIQRFEMVSQSETFQTETLATNRKLEETATRLLEQRDQLERTNRLLEEQTRRLTQFCGQLLARLPAPQGEEWLATAGDGALTRAIYNARGRPTSS